jgi:Zn-dependent protease
VTSTFPLGRIAGVRVGAHWSVLVIFGLIASGLATGLLPQSYPARSAAAYAVTGVIAALLFLLSLLAHEGAHAVVARRNHLGVEGITLWLFGGVSRLQGMAETAGADFRVAAAGPLTSLVLAAVFGGAARAADAVLGNTLTVGALAWLAIANLALAIFNALPAAPLDGGRLLRAFLWRMRGDRDRAARSAARAGRWLGYLMVVAGLFEVLYGGGFGGLWLVMLGWFLTGAATAEERETETRTRIAGVRVGDVMTRDPQTAPAWLTLDAVTDGWSASHRHSSFPIVDESGRLVGLVTLRRLRSVPRPRWASTRLRDVACPLSEVATASESEMLTDVLPRLTACADGRALVMSDGRLIGIVSPSDITRAVRDTVAPPSPPSVTHPSQGATTS